MTYKEIQELNAVEPFCFEDDTQEQWYKYGLVEGAKIGYKQAEKDLTDKAKLSSGWDGFYYGQGYKQAEKDIAEHIKLAYGKVSMNPFDCSEAFEELLKTIGAV